MWYLRQEHMNHRFLRPRREQDIDFVVTMAVHFPK
jgi:hypothetical protein